MKKLLYVANIRFPTEKAHGEQVREMCNALTQFADVTLLIPNRRTEGTPESFGLSPRVRVVRIPVIDTVPLGYIGFLFESLCFATGAVLYALLRARGSLILTREYGCTLAFSLGGFSVAWESHRGEWNPAVRFALARGASLVVISKGLKSFYLSKDVPQDSILIAPDGVDLARYQNLPEKAEARRRLSLPLERHIGIYNGHLHTWKGAETLAQAAQFLPDNFLLLFMGGTDEDIKQFKKRYGDDPRIAIVGRKPDEERPLYLRAADVAVLPNTAKDLISATYTSPLKLFGYMAAETPIVASDLPSIREILSERTAFFARPDDPASFAHALIQVVEHPAEARSRAKAAYAEVGQYEWQKRARYILDFLTL